MGIVGVSTENPSVECSIHSLPTIRAHAEKVFVLAREPTRPSLSQLSQEAPAYGAAAAGSSRMGTVLHFSPNVRRPL